jgi:two-component system LytT family sensor kinase
MKAFFKPNKTELISFLAGMPFICFLLNGFLFGSRQYHDYRIWAFSFPLIFLQGLVSWYFHIGAMHWLRERFPDIQQTRTRLVLLAFCHMCMITLTYLSLFYAYDRFHFLSYQLDYTGLRAALFLGVALTLIGTSLWEATYTFTKWRTSVTEKERMEQLTILHEFEALKSQVNPHFLFNCFNTLSSLISEDRKQAEVFLDELSKVYRYLLRNNESGLSSVQSEVKFIESYYKLLQTRHGEAVQVKIDVDKRYTDYLLPSLSLQLLVENAVKHNVLSKNHPLVIDIFTTAGNKLIVNNNLQRRSVKAPSNKVGLENIRSKYALLDQSGFQVLENGKSFSVVLPLIWSKVADKKLINA